MINDLSGMGSCKSTTANTSSGMVPCGLNTEITLFDVGPCESNMVKTLSGTGLCKSNTVNALVVNLNLAMQQPTNDIVALVGIVPCASNIVKALAAKNETANTLFDVVPCNSVTCGALLQQKWSVGKPYVAVGGGDVANVLAVNPQREIHGMNGPLQWQRCEQVVEQMDTDSGEPHVYLASAKALRRIVVQGRSRQCVITTGESGSGKTESTKLMLEHVAKGEHRQLMASNPVLEAFGNASTMANENSSRFGKEIRVYLNIRGSVESASIRTFLFEKSRVTAARNGVERNFHVFYQLLGGLAAGLQWLKCAQTNVNNASPPNSPSSSSTMSRFLGLDNMTANDFEYLKSDTIIPSIEEIMRDAAGAADTLACLSFMGVSSSRRVTLFRVLAAVLHLGNIKECDFQSPSAMHVSRLLGFFAPDQLERALCERTVSARGETFVARNTNAQIQDARDALARLLYSLAFSWIVERVNESLGANKPETDLSRYIAFLDLMGFEKMAFNSLEQLLINFANEKIHNEYVLQTISGVKAEYEAEGIAYFNFQAPKDCVELFDHPVRGLISLLEQECVLGGGTDEGFVRKLSKTRHRDIAAGRLHGERSFEVNHFAGPVVYDSSGFILKNRDAIASGLFEFIKTSPIMNEIVLTSSQPASVNGRRPRTMGKYFQSELENILSEMKTSHDVTWVRCIRPNLTKSSTEFDCAMVQRQLEACGILKAIEIARGSFSNRMARDVFFARYESRISNVHAMPVKICFGKTKVYFDNNTLHVLDFELAKRAVVQLQAFARGRSAKLLRHRQMLGVLALQVQLRKSMMIKADTRFKIMCTIAIQSKWRYVLAKRKQNALVAAAVAFELVMQRKVPFTPLSFYPSEEVAGSSPLRSNYSPVRSSCSPIKKQNTTPRRVVFHEMTLNIEWKSNPSKPIKHRSSAFSGALRLANRESLKTPYNSRTARWETVHDCLLDSIEEKEN